MKKKFHWSYLCTVFLLVLILAGSLSVQAEGPADMGDVSSLSEEKIGEVVRYDDMGEYSGDWKESRIYVNGSDGFCIDPLTPVDPGSVLRQDLLSFGMSKDNITGCGLIAYYVDHYCPELSDNNKYLMKQILIWRQLNGQYGFNCGNIVLGAGTLSGEDQGRIIAACNSFVNENLKRYEGYGYAFLNEGQDLAQFSIRKIVGNCKLKKEAAYSEMTAGISGYSLEGAVYGLYSDAQCTQEIERFTTDEEGVTEEKEVVEGDYYFKEISASPGYRVNDEVYPVTVVADETVTVEALEMPVLGSAEIFIEKLDRDTASHVPTGAGSLEGAGFVVNYYGDFYDEDTLPDTPTRSWVIKALPIDTVESESGTEAADTLGNGSGAESADAVESGSEGSSLKKNAPRYVALLDEAHLIMGDDFYMVNDQIVLPMGTITIEEIQAPEHYVLERSRILVASLKGDKDPTEPEENEGIIFENTGARRYLTHMIQSGEALCLEAGYQYQAMNTLMRGDFHFTKLDAETQKTMAGVSFKITSKTTGEYHYITTDENGNYDSSAKKISHLKNTNGGEAGDGLWFGMCGNSEKEGGEFPVSEPDDSLGALPYDTYIIKELKGKNNANKIMYEGEFVINEGNTSVNLGSIQNHREVAKTNSEKGRKVQTGDTNKVDLYAALIGGSFALVVIIVGVNVIVRRKRGRRKMIL